MLELININFTKDNKHILRDINLKLEGNDFIVITGPNGSGKSTLAKIIMGIEKPDSGSIIWNGEDITNYSIDCRAKMGISFAFQTPVKFKGITVYDILKLALNQPIEKNDACEILSKVGLCAKDYIDREINNSLSGGELKRIEIATVIAKKPKLAIFDEPEAGIDIWSFQNLIDVFQDRKINIKGMTIVISHQEKILNNADKIILIENGQIKTVGNRKEVYSNIFPRICCQKGNQNGKC